MTLKATLALSGPLFTAAPLCAASAPDATDDERFPLRPNANEGFST